MIIVVADLASIQKIILLTKIKSECHAEIRLRPQSRVFLVTNQALGRKVQVRSIWLNEISGLALLSIDQTAGLLQCGVSFNHALIMTITILMRLFETVPTFRDHIKRKKKAAADLFLENTSLLLRI